MDLLLRHVPAPEPEDPASAARALRRLLTGRFAYSNQLGVLARSITQGMRELSPDDADLIQPVVEIIVALYGGSGHLDAVGQYGVPLDHLIGWLELLRERAPEAAAGLLQRLTSGGHLARPLTVCRGAFPDQPGDGDDLLLLLLGARKPAPPAAWLERWQALHRRLDNLALRSALVELTAVQIDAWGPREGDPPLIAARGACWALGDFPEREVRDHLASNVLTWARSGAGSPAVGGAAVWALARPADEEAMVRLLDLRRQIKHKYLLARIEEALAGLATASGLSPDQVADRQVPDHGLDLEGRRTWQLDGYTVTLSLAPGRGFERAVRDPAGAAIKALPAGVRQAYEQTWKEIGQESKALAATLTVQRARLEEAMVEGRTWTLPAWREVFGRHPILASLARRLVWHIQGPTPILGIPSDGAWRDEQGHDVPVPEDALLSVVHPLALPDGAQLAWQRLIVEARIVQPFKQLFRETYVVTPAEAEAGYSSARFAGQPVALTQIYALARSRGWSGPLGQTGFDGAGEGRREFPAFGVRAVVRHSADPGYFAEIESVHFERSVQPGRGRRPSWEPLRLADVPAIPFSEAMRDVDLLVSVATAGNEAQWLAWEADREAGRLQWAQQREVYQRALVETSASRAALLAQLLPILGVADRVTVDGHFALVRGRRGRYRVHLGTGNIHLEPSGRYLCIVPARAREPIFLPFESEDGKTGEIVSKIVLLARDDTIKDPSILRQLPQDLDGEAW